MTRAFAVMCLLALTACGADAPPEKPGVTVTGDAQMGVVIE